MPPGREIFGDCARPGLDPSAGSDVPFVRREALVQRVGPAEALQPGSDLGVSQAGVVPAVGADDLEPVGVAAFCTALHYPARLAPQACPDTVAMVPNGRDRRVTHHWATVCGRYVMHLPVGLLPLCRSRRSSLPAQFIQGVFPYFRGLEQ